MYYLIYVYFDPSASLYDDGVININETGDAFDTIEEGYQYIEKELIDHIKVDASEGEIDPQEIKAHFSKNEKTKEATVDLFYQGQLLYRYIYWLKSAWLYDYEIKNKNK